MRDALPELVEPVPIRLLVEGGNPTTEVEAENPHARGVVHRDRLRRNRDVGAAVDVLVDELGVVHPVEVIPRENQVVVGVVLDEMARGLPDGVRGALVPVRVVRRLLGREDLDEPLAEDVHAIRLPDVAVERRRVELRQHEDATNVRMQTVTDWDVDQPVGAADWNGRLRPVQRQRKKARALAAAQNNREDLVVHRHADTHSLHRGRTSVRPADIGYNPPASASAGEARWEGEWRSSI